MCMSTPDVPAPPPPPQDAKTPDSTALRRQARRNGMQAGTVLTGPSGVAAGGLNTGGSTLLGS